jgi:DNA-directed RNA polymerase alpha subunit
MRSEERTNEMSELYQKRRETLLRVLAVMDHVENEGMTESQACRKEHISRTKFEAFLQNGLGLERPAAPERTVPEPVRTLSREELEQMSVDELPVARGIRNSVYRSGITNVWELSRLTSHEIRKIRHVGEVGIEKLDRALNELGVRHGRWVD